MKNFKTSAAAAVAVGVIFLITGCSSPGATTTVVETTSATQEAPKKESKKLGETEVIYEATTTGSQKASIMFGDNMKNKNFSKTFKATENVDGLFSVAMSSVTSMDMSSEVSCKITVNGEVVAEETGDGMVSCSNI